jgi:hypothetical protein
MPSRSASDGTRISGMPSIYRAFNALSLVSIASL